MRPSEGCVASSILAGRAKRARRAAAGVIRNTGAILQGYAAHMQPRMTARKPSLLLAALLGSCLVLACNRGDGEARAPAAAASGALSASPAASFAASAGAPNAAAPNVAASAPPVSVTLVRVAQRDMAVQLEANGAVAPLSTVEVRPQMSSVIARVSVREGQFVRAGELLFTLDARADEANVAKVRAQMARDEAALADAQRQLARSRELLAQNFVSQGALDANQTLVESQLAAVAADRAALDAARVSLSYARITAPGPGRVGAINVFPGSSVQANQTTLVTITQLDPINVAFNLPQRNLQDALAALAAMKGAGGEVIATLVESKESFKGRLQFVDNAVDPASGTVKVKAVFDNKERKLWPGAFVNVRMVVRTLEDALVLPRAALIESARGTIVYVVDREGKAMARPVQLVTAQGDDAVVTGVKAGERVVLDGRQNLRPGAMTVERPREGGPRGASAPGAPGAGRRASAPEAAGSTPAGPGNGASGGASAGANTGKGLQP